LGHVDPDEEDGPEAEAAEEDDEEDDEAVDEPDDEAEDETDDEVEDETDELDVELMDPDPDEEPTALLDPHAPPVPPAPPPYPKTSVLDEHAAEEKRSARSVASEPAVTNRASSLRRVRLTEADSVLCCMRFSLR
jgi:hypothetical protein